VFGDYQCRVMPKGYGHFWNKGFCEVGPILIMPLAKSITEQKNLTYHACIHGLIHDVRLRACPLCLLRLMNVFR
jgi:hypothetical protein